MFNFLVALLARASYFIISALDPSIQKDFIKIKGSILPQVEIENIKLLRTVVLIEDKRYLSHYGVDFRGIVRASCRTLFYKRLEGGSTIEQQYVRLVTNRREVTIKRKIREAMLAVELSRSFSKSQILNSYLLNYSFGGRFSFKSLEVDVIKALNDDDISHLVAKLKYPFAHVSNPSYLRRVIMVRALMDKQRLSQRFIPFVRQRV